MDVAATGVRRDEDTDVVWNREHATCLNHRRLQPAPAVFLFSDMQRRTLLRAFRVAADTYDPARVGLLQMTPFRHMAKPTLPPSARHPAAAVWATATCRAANASFGLHTFTMPNRSGWARYCREIESSVR